MHDTKAFEPLSTHNNGVVGLLPSVTVAASAVSATTSAIFPGNLDNNGFVQIQVANTTASFAYLNFGQLGTIAAATVATGFPVAPGTVLVTVASDVNAASVILGSGTGNVIFTRGQGL